MVLKEATPQHHLCSLCQRSVILVVVFFFSFFLTDKEFVLGGLGDTGKVFVDILFLAGNASIFLLVGWLSVALRPQKP